MANIEKSDDYVKWATIVVQGKTSLKEIAQEAEEARNNICGTLAEEPMDKEDLEFAKFLMEVQSGRYTDDPMLDTENGSQLN